MKYILPLLFFHFTLSAQLVGKVVAIADGDTFTMLVDSKEVKIRMHGIDCPEKKQDFGNVAKETLSEYIFGKEVTAQKMGTDRYRRTLAMVTVDGVNVNEAMLKAGLAWHYVEYDKNPAWAELEAAARKSKKGLWVQGNAIPPWEFRGKGRGKSVIGDQ